MHVDISEILKGKTGSVNIAGWIQSKRSSGGIQFLTLRDGSDFIQCTLYKKKFDKKTYDEVEKLSIQSVVEIEGIVKKDDRAKEGYEVAVERIKILSKAQGHYPITKKSHGMKFLLDNRHVSLRSKKIHATMQIREKVIDFARGWLKQNGYKEIQAPILTGMTQEGGAKLFEVKYFDQKAYLSQSWQLYGEAIMHGFGKCFTIAPSFSAESSRTRRHLAEFWQLEVEIPFCDFENAMKIEEKLIRYILENVAKDCTRELSELGRNAEDLKMAKGFQNITYDNAIKILEKDGMPAKWGEVLGADEEDKLIKHFDTPFFITNLPKNIVAFYHKEDANDSKLCLCGDLLAPNCGNLSFCGAGIGERIDDEKQLIERMEEMKLDMKKYQWYVDLRKWGTVQHSGFAIGIERLLMLICNLKNIRNATLFPRTMNRLYP